MKKDFFEKEEKNDTQIIYFDHAATTPLCAAARRAMEPFWDRAFGNPSSLHALGREAKAALERSRRLLADLLGADPKEVFFTSGGTESVNLAVKGALFPLKDQKTHIVYSAVEHPCVLETVEWLKRQGFQATRVEVDESGMVSPKAVEKAIRPETALVSVMAANNETGAVQPVAEIASLARRMGALFHTDAAQAFGKITLPKQLEGIDLLSASAHKFAGPKGVGFLYVRRGVPLVPLLHGGGQERAFRSGTENVAGVAAMAQAAQEAFRKKEENRKKLEGLTAHLWEGLKKIAPDFRLNGPKDASQRVPGLLNVSFPGIEGEALVHALDRHGFALSTGSACATGAAEPSHVLAAMGRSPKEAREALRISLGGSNTLEEIEQFLETLGSVLQRLRVMRAVWREEDET